ncbi:hypothetical protein H2203_009101 [Taxawa tesnikishii (nom. ined.)]|nr:hypothetical protein H2203_009101 [Dothideales sp. JES 119]
MALLHTFHAREPNVSGLEIIDEQQASRALHSLLDWLSEEAVAKRNETAHYHKFVNMLDRRRVFWELRFGVTEAGRFCVVPSQCQLTDYITVISGVRRPVVVRPKDGFHQLIGECYAYGIMDDQNDPHLSYSSYIADCSRKKRCSDGDYSQEDTSTALPPGWTPGALEQGRQIFEHGGLGIRTTHDPRFPHLGTGPCPKGWHAGRCAWGGKTTVPLGRRVYFINEDTGETTWDDPCLVDEPAHFPGIRLL